MRVLRLIGYVLRRTFVDPVADGRLKDTGWPPGLRAVVGVGVGLYALLMLAAVFSSTARSRLVLIISPPDDTLPALAVPLLCLALIMAMSCLFTAALHVVWWLRIPLMVIVIVSVISPIDWAVRARVDYVTLGLALSLVVMAGLRWRRPFHWLEFVVSLVVIGHAVVLHQAVRLAPLIPYASNLQLTQLSVLLLPLWALALPVAALAGAALVEITTSAVTWTVTGIWGGTRMRGPRTTRLLGVVLLALVIVRVVQVVVRVTRVTDPIGVGQLVLAGVICAVVLGCCAGVTALADRTEDGDRRRRPDPEDLLPVWGRWAPLFALVVVVPVSVPALLAYVLRGVQLVGAADAVEALDISTGVDVWIGLVCLGLLGLALELARRGRRMTPVLLTAFAGVLGASLAVELLHFVLSTDAVLIAVSLAAVGLLAWLAGRRRLTTQSRVALAGVLLLSVAYEYRDWVNEPLTQALGLTGVSAALLVGLLWRLLSDNEFSRGDSAWLPQPSRVLLALASAVIGVTSAAQVALLGGRADLDLSQTEGLGDRLIGFSLVLAVAFTGLTLAARGRDVGRIPAAVPEDVTTAP